MYDAKNLNVHVGYTKINILVLSWQLELERN